jgi:site-specific recombinase XerD
MAIEKKLNYSIEEISSFLGVSRKELQNFLDNQNENIPIKEVHEESLAITVINEYHSNLKALVAHNKRSTETWTTYNNFLKRIIRYLNDEEYLNLKISEVNEIFLYRAINKTAKKEIKYTPRTLNKYNAIMRSIMRYSFEMNYTQKDLSYRFKLDKTTLVPRYIKDEDIVHILNVVKKFSKPFRCRAMIIFLLGTGCRVSELSKLKVKDFDIDNELIFIQNGKGNKDRYIPMFPEVKEEILDYLRKSGMEKWDSNCEGYLFARDEGIERKRNFPIRTIEHLVDRIRIQLPHINHITAHTFRHTFAVKSLKIGIEPHNLTLMLGHTDPKTTMIYTQLYNEDLKKQITDRFPFPFENLLNQVIQDDGE